MCVRTCVSRQAASFIGKRYNLPQNLHRHNPSEQLYIGIFLVNHENNIWKNPVLVMVGLCKGRASVGGGGGGRGNENVD